MTEEEVRKIVQQELAKNYTSGSPDVPPHAHNGTDNLNIDPVDLIGWSSIPTSGNRYWNQDTEVYEVGYGANLTPSSSATGDAFGHSAQFLHNLKLSTYPFVIIQGNGVGPQSAFNGGFAPDGTMIFFDNGGASVLYIRSNGMWRGVNFNLFV